MNLSKLLRERLLEYDNNILTVYHGTNSKHLNNILNNGLVDKTSNYNSASWYMVSTDLNSALFHATPQDEDDVVYVIEFNIPVTDNDRWFGFPYLWKGYVRNDKSTWFALKQPLTKNMINKVHKIGKDIWLKQKNDKY
jgi:hypothetical protein